MNEEYNKLIKERNKNIENKKVFFLLTTKMYFFPLYYFYKKIKTWLWFSIKLKRNEFDKSLNLDIDTYKNLNKEERKQYEIDLVKKRNLAHELSI